MCQGRPSLIYFYDIFWLLGSRGVKGPSHCWFLIEIFHVWKSDVIVEWYKEGCLRSSLQTLTNKTRPIQAPDTLCTCCMSLVAAVGPRCQWGLIPSYTATQCRHPVPLTPSNAALIQHYSMRLSLATGETALALWWTFTVVFGTEWDMIQCCEDNADTGESSQTPGTPTQSTHTGGCHRPGWRLQVFLADTKHVRWRWDKIRDSLRDMSRESSQFPSWCHTVNSPSRKLIGLSSLAKNYSC